MILSIRPITTWPGELRRPSQRRGSPFEASYSGTLELLDRELRMLRATVVVVQLAVNEGQIRRDGKLYSRAMPDHPGVILSFQTPRGHFRYAADRFTHWHANLRAIALGLEALRKIERYGIGSGTEQYTGFLQLETSNGDAMTLDEALKLFSGWTGELPTVIRNTWRDRRDWFYRVAAKVTHSDTGGGDAEFQRMGKALRLLDAELKGQVTWVNMSLPRPKDTR